jgi:hypothetical protein
MHWIRGGDREGQEAQAPWSQEGAFGGRLPQATFAAWALFACGTEKFSGEYSDKQQLEDGNTFFGAGGNIFIIEEKTCRLLKNNRRIHG